MTRSTDGQAASGSGRTRFWPSLALAMSVAVGGAFGAVLRVSTVELAALFSVPGWLAVVAINAIGGVAIGVAFVHLEARFLEHARSRLADSPHAPPIEARGWLLDVDQTLDPVDLFRAEVRLRRLSGYWVTGLLGGFTTFSSFAVEMFELAGALDPMRFAGIYVAAACLPLATTVLGLIIGSFTLPHRSRAVQPR